MAYNSVRWACLVSLAPKREKRKYHSLCISRGYGLLVQERCPKHSSMGRARMKEDKETDEDKKRGVSVERSKAGAKKRSPTSYH